MIGFIPTHGDRPLWEEAAILIFAHVGFLIIAYALGWMSANIFRMKKGDE